MIIFVAVFSFFAEYIDSALGMGYGTILAPVLLLLGFKPLEVVPVILFSELITGILSAVLHHRQGNVNLSLASGHLRVALTLAVFSIAGVACSILFVLNLPGFWIKIYIASVVIIMGFVIIFTANKRYKFSWFKIMLLGLVASFNKGASGGGYGPLIVGGQILSGVPSKPAIGITSLAEGLTCIVALLGYIVFAGSGISWRLVPYIVTGSVLAVPLAVRTVKIIPETRLKIIIALLSIILGLFVACKTIWP